MGLETAATGGFVRHLSKLPFTGALRSRAREQEGHEADTNLLEKLQRQFEHFRALVELNNELLARIGDMEEKSQGDYLFDVTYITRSLNEIQALLDRLLGHYAALGGPSSDDLRGVATSLLRAMRSYLPWSSGSDMTDITLPYDDIHQGMADDVGTKNAVLGELLALGYTVPRGFAITGQAYRLLMEELNIAGEISERFASVDIDNVRELETLCSSLQDRIRQAVFPAEVREAILARFDACFGPDDHVVLRSSAIGEDTILSFAGQYSTVLNVTRDGVLDAYRDVVASKFSANTLYYFLSHSIADYNYPMSAGCSEFIDAVCSGVIFTRDPIDPEQDRMQVHSSWGLGSSVVEGSDTPDVFELDLLDGTVLQQTIAPKPVKLAPSPEGRLTTVSVPEEQQNHPSLNEAQLRELRDVAMTVEDHFKGPQDIEFAYDRNGRLVLLQTRPLRTICYRPSFTHPDLRGHLTLAQGGTTACPGAATGRVVVVRDPHHLDAVMQGDVLVTSTPSPLLAGVLSRVAAVVTEVGSTASHLATLAREHRVPAIVGMSGARHRLPAGETVTVDATSTTVYAGELSELVQARRPEYDLFADTAIFDLLHRLLSLLSPLNLLNPDDKDFTVANCSTVHDIVRFVHQRGIEAIFQEALQFKARARHSRTLQSALPVTVHILPLDEPESDSGKNTIRDDSIPSLPMQEFWNGVLAAHWPDRDHAESPQRGMRSYALDIPAHQRQFSKVSFAVVRQDYMLFNLRLGYHFTSVEATMTETPHQNTIRIHYKGGGAANERRKRRIYLVEELLDRMGFEHNAKSDFIDAHITGLDLDAMKQHLYHVGQLFIMTKQLDMALSNERITRWYIEDFARMLNLPHSDLYQ